MSSDANASASAWPQSIPPSVERSAPSLELAHQLRMRREAVGDAEQLLVERAQPVGADRRDHVVACSGRDVRVAARRRLGLTERLLQRLVRLAQLGHDVLLELVRLLLREVPVGDEACCELLAHRGMVRDRGRQQRLGICGLVLLVVAVPPVADEVDEDVVAEAAPIRKRKPDRGERSLGIVGVDVDDRDVEALCEVARVPCRAPELGVGGEPDLVVRDQMERAAGRVARERLEVERLGDAALAGERCVPVDEDREGDARIVKALARGTVGLLRPRTSLDHRVDRLEVARVGHERDGDVAGRGRPRPLRAEVVLDVAAASLLAGDDGLDRPLALELAQDRLVRPPDDVREDVQPAAMRHAEHDLVRAVPRGKVDRLVEHRDHHVQTLDGELLLTEEGASQVALHPLHLAQAPEQPHSLVAGERTPVAARLDRLAEPDALLVIRDVLDLVRDRPGVGLTEVRQRVGQRLALHVQAEERGRDARLQLGRELREQALGLESWIAGRLRTEWVEAGREMPVHPERLDERHRRGDPSEELLVLRRDRGSGPGAGAGGGVATGAA